MSTAAEASAGSDRRPALPPAAAAAYAAATARAAQKAPADVPPQVAPVASHSVRQRLTARVRLLPLTILAVALLLGLKIGTLWRGGDGFFVPPSWAQQQPAPAAGAAAQAPGQAPAQNPGQSATPGQPSAQPSGQAGAAGGAAAPNPAVGGLADKDPTTFTRAEIELLANLAQRREQLEQRARELDLRESLLAAAEKRIDERIAELKKLQDSIKQIVQQYDKQEEENLKGLVKIYETMKPEDASKILEKLDANVQLAVLERMKEGKVAAIMSKMDAKTAQDITVRLATRKQLPANLRAGATAAPAQPAAAQPPKQGG